MLQDKTLAVKLRIMNEAMRISHADSNRFSRLILTVMRCGRVKGDYLNDLVTNVITRHLSTRRAARKLLTHP